MKKMIIAIDGLAGSGKTTMSEMVATRLAAKGISTLIISPENTAFGRQLASVDCRQAMNPSAATHLKVAALIEAASRAKYAQEDCVILDGFTPALYAELSQSEIPLIRKIMTQHMPDIDLLFLLFASGIEARKFLGTTYGICENVYKVYRKPQVFDTFEVIWKRVQNFLDSMNSRQEPATA